MVDVVMQDENKKNVIDYEPKREPVKPDMLSSFLQSVVRPVACLWVAYCIIFAAMSFVDRRHPQPNTPPVNRWAQVGQCLLFLMLAAPAAVWIYMKWPERALRPLTPTHEMERGMPPHLPPIPDQVLNAKLNNGQPLSAVYAPEDLWQYFPIEDPAAFASIWKNRLREAIDVHRNAELVHKAQRIVDFLDGVGNVPLQNYSFKKGISSRDVWVIYEPKHGLCVVVEGEQFQGRGSSSPLIQRH